MPGRCSAPRRYYLTEFLQSPGGEELCCSHFADEETEAREVNSVFRGLALSFSLLLTLRLCVAALRGGITHISAFFPTAACYSHCHPGSRRGSAVFMNEDDG